jgi:DNA-binding GntR family transcriptional regulator
MSDARRTTQKERAYRYLRERFENGELKPGDRVSDLALSREIDGVSRTPIREALNQLASEGLIEFIPHRGAFVRRPDLREIEEFYELRELLEGHAASRLAAAPDPVALAELEKRVDEMASMVDDLKSGDDSLSTEATRRQRRLDLEFHRILLEACGNCRLSRIVEDSRVLARPFEAMETRMWPASLRSATREHAAILEAIQAGDSERARHAMTSHIHSSLGNVRRVLAQQAKG